METITITKREYEKLAKERGNDVSTGKSRGFEFDKISPFIGLWKKRKDIKDSVAYIRKLREKEDKRSW